MKDFWLAYMTQKRIDRYEWAKKVDPAAVEAFEAKAKRERDAVTTK